jgi:frataxin-like iron-binding protein CyaY
MGMDVGEFEEAATTWLNELFERLELEDAEAKLDMRLDDGEMEITIDEEHHRSHHSAEPSISKRWMMVRIGCWMTGAGYLL